MIFTFNTWPSLPAPWRKKNMTCHPCKNKNKTTPASRGNSSSRPALISKDLYIYIYYIYTMFHASFLVGEKWPLDRGLLGDWFSDLLDSSHQNPIFLNGNCFWINLPFGWWLTWMSKVIPDGTFPFCWRGGCLF